MTKIITMKMFGVNLTPSCPRCHSILPVENIFAGEPRSISMERWMQMFQDLIVSARDEHLKTADCPPVRRSET